MSRAASTTGRGEVARTPRVLQVSTALYRRYRPETFADVIGQEHVTDPLRAALRSDRITHAYLFSGPRGCGKTTSARIFARCLNCVEGPTDTPCGTCPSCVELARDGAGSLDVVEMDAASHGGVDDARELRERAAFAPARDRYKIFIIDEAHMVTNQGFNALLKLVEEPPAHVKFVFATTEPEKVIGTIRSRTHHYPFRLVPPERLQAYLEGLCTTEGVAVEEGVLPLVVRAGGGSVRDSLSVLDQLIAGAEEGRISYERAVTLLGYTHATLLDDVVDALAARDGASLFRVVERVIDSGHDPRRFAEDLLERIRDLVVIAVSGEHAATVLRSLPKDQFERMRVQSQQLGPAELSRAGDLVNDALTEMSGATSPRLQLELLCARLLLPRADDAARGYAARLDRIERHLAGGGPSAAVRPAEAAPEQPAPAHSAPQTQAAPARSAAAGAAGAAPSHAGPGQTWQQRTTTDGAAPPARGEPAQRATTPGAAPSAAPAEPPQRGGAPRTASSAAPAEPEGAPDTFSGPGAATDHAAAAAGDRPQVTTGPRAPEPAAAPQQPAARTGAQRAPEAPPAPSADADLIRRRWPEVLSTLARFKRSTWALVSQNAQVGELSGGVLHLAFATSGLAHTFRNGAHAEPLQRALLETLGVQVRIEPVLSQAAESGQAGAPYGTGAAPSSAWGGGGAAASSGDSAWSAPAPGSSGWTAAGAAAAPGGAAGTASSPSASTPGGSATPPEPAPVPPAPAGGTGQDDQPGAASPWATAATPGTASPSAPSPAGPEEPIARVSLAEDTPSMDDPDAEHSGLVGAPLIERMLGGTIIHEE